MLLIPTIVAPSTVQGLGLFAAEPIAAGAPVWRFEPGFDRLLDAGWAATLPPVPRAFLDRHAYRSPEFPGQVVMPGDDARFLNHSETPNIESAGRQTHALRDIAAGEELFCDYRQTVAGWNGF